MGGAASTRYSQQLLATPCQPVRSGHASLDVRWWCEGTGRFKDFYKILTRPEREHLLKAAGRDRGATDYLERGELFVEVLGRGFASLVEASHFVQILEQRKDLRIACPEEIALRLRYISLEQFRALARLASVISISPRADGAIRASLMVDGLPHSLGFAVGAVPRSATPEGQHGVRSWLGFNVDAVSGQKAIELALHPSLAVRGLGCSRISLKGMFVRAASAAMKPNQCRQHETARIGRRTGTGRCSFSILATRRSKRLVISEQPPCSQGRRDAGRCRRSRLPREQRHCPCLIADHTVRSHSAPSLERLDGCLRVGKP
jgi:hypothetical protein